MKKDIVVKRESAESGCLDILSLFEKNRNVFVLFLEEEETQKNGFELPFGVMDKEKIRLAVEGLRGKTPDQAYNYLIQDCYHLSREEKSIAYTLGTYQPQILLDGDLKKFIEEHRKNTGNLRGLLIEDLDERKKFID